MSKQTLKTLQAIGLGVGLGIVVLGPFIFQSSEATAQPTRPGTTIARDVQRIDDLERNVVCYQSYQYGGGLSCLQVR